MKSVKMLFITITKIFFKTSLKKWYNAFHAFVASMHIAKSLELTISHFRV